MINGLKLINLPPSQEFTDSVHSFDVGNVFVLRTCQRTLLMGFNEGPQNLIQKVTHQNKHLTFELEELIGHKAYEFLLETICGLKSRILGENEIVHQFKEAYNTFLNNKRPNRHVQNILEKLFTDAKKIRSQHLRELGLQTYASIVRKVLIEKLAATDFSTPILILGSGQLAEDLVKICYKKFNLSVSARNATKLKEICDQYRIRTLSWFNPLEISKYPIIINTIGTQDVLFDHNFFSNWQDYQAQKELPSKVDKLFIDLSEPSPVQTNLKLDDGLWRLQDIFEQGEKLSQKREVKLKEAQKAIEGVCQKRVDNLTFQMPFGWEELQFA